MVEFILEKFTEITSKCLEKNAKEYQSTKKSMQLVFKLSNNDLEYIIYKDYEPKKVLTFLEVLGVKIDFKGYSLFVPKFIKNALENFCKEENIDKDKVRIMLTFNDDNELILWLYNSNQYIKQFELIDLFDNAENVDFLEQ